ncbi:hypothetical protein C8F04DRAFT_1400371 [Mycena alexandri]|uniref:Uncharacterized protein n=1 Tax=Mycena alexandri TaxID=1745969 RepID=A0AAD6WYF7_9AGAR|nr:hypothetical protein C8F04DRAFT_1400371 [Mycena alexandri]
MAEALWHIGDYSRGKSHARKGQEMAANVPNIMLEAAELLTRARERLALCGLQNGRQDRICHTRNIHFLTEYPNHGASNLMNIAFIDAATGVSETSVVQNVDAARAIFHATPFPRGLSACDTIIAMLDLREGRTAVAKAAFEALYISSRGKHAEISLLCLEKLADHAYQMNGLLTTARWDVIPRINSQGTE